MAISIFHGEPGSYKTSTAIWFTILPALREGRLVVTNIEGMKPLEVIEKELDEVFPESAQLWRISSQNAEGVELLRNFYSWLPIGAFLLIDEVQGVYPTDRSFKAESLGKHKPDDFEHLPLDYKKEFYRRLDMVKPEYLEDGDTDDLGNALFDENGLIIYPNNMTDAFLRHRKYQWDIVVCTPDISEVHSLIRSSAQKAYAHRSCDDVGRIIPYYKRRPRIMPHNPKLTGTTVKKTDTYFHRKIPVQVHLFYKSTATGAFNESNSGRTPLQDPMVIFSLFIIIFAICYWGWFIYDKLKDEPLPEVTAYEINQTSVSIPLSSSPKAGITDSNTQARKNDFRFSDNVDLPYQASAIYLSGVFSVYTDNRFFVKRDLFFNLKVGDSFVSMASDELIELGYELEYKSDCLVYVRTSKKMIPALCEPVKIKNQIQPSESKSLLSMI